MNNVKKKLAPYWALAKINLPRLLIFKNYILTCLDVPNLQNFALALRH